MNASGANKQMLEEHILQSLEATARRYILNADDVKTFTLLTEDLKQKKHSHALQLKNFALEILEFKRTSDSFNSKRKAYAFNILNMLSETYEIPETIELCIQHLKDAKPITILAILSYLEVYINSRNIEPSTTLIKILDKKFATTKSQDVAYNILNFQVKIGFITEGMALSKIDDWKDKNEAPGYGMII
ncbi:hypothetical protein TI05_04675 [Achromatium sp. WMS3]|nr:hypothetical protein TI05_04675 [Achromatium sp. WMS3]